MARFIMYDGRANVDPDSAQVMDTAASISDVRRSNRAHRGEDYVWFEYDESSGQLTNPRRRDDLHDV